MKRTNSLLITLYFLFCALTLNALYLVTTYLPGPDEHLVRVTLPALTGTLLSKDDDRLSPELFSVTYDYRADAATPPGTVLSQHPAAGATRYVAPGHAPCHLHLTLSTGVARHTLPPLVGKSAREAAVELRGMGLTVQLRELTRAELPDGRILATAPEAGTEIAEGEIVTLIVARAPQERSVSVPGVVGTPAQVAYGILVLRGLVPTAPDYAYSDTVPAGSVISQHPLPNTLVPAGTAATLTISLGRQEELWGMG